MNQSTILLLAASLVTTTIVHAQEVPSTSAVPRRVIETLESRFPGAKIRKLTTEKEEGNLVYDIEFSIEGQQFEADIRDDGSIHNWEKAIDPADLPAPVMTAVRSRYPGTIVTQAMQITIISNGKEVLEGYEIVMDSSTKEVEITVAADGKILEDSGQPE
jgi:hypothetical protein